MSAMDTAGREPSSAFERTRTDSADWPRGAKAARRLGPALAALAFAVGYLRGFVVPHMPLLFWGDAPGFATKGARMLRGEMPYRDFFEFLTPGTDLVYAALFRCFGIHPWLPNLTMAFLVALAAWLLTYCAARVARGWMVALPALLLVGFVLYGSLDATHHWFSTVLALAAAATLLDSRSLVRVGSSGLLVGLAACFTQTKGVAVAIGIVIFLVWQARGEERAPLWRRVGVFLSAAALIFLTVNLPFVLMAGVGRWWSQIFVFPVRYFGSVSANNLMGTWPELLAHHGMLKWICTPFLYVGLPLIYGRFFWRMARRGESKPEGNERNEPWDALLLVAIVGAAMLAVMLPAASIRRISCVSPPAMILLAWQLSRAGAWRRRAALGLAAASCLIAMAQIAAIQKRHSAPIALFRGTFVLPDAEYYELYRWTADHTQPGQPYFGFEMMELPLGLRNVTALESLGPGEYTRPEQVAQAIADVERARPPLLIMPQAVVAPETMGFRFDHLQPFRDYLRNHYTRVKTFAGGYEAWERDDGGNGRRSGNDVLVGPEGFEPPTKGL